MKNQEGDKVAMIFEQKKPGEHDGKSPEKNSGQEHPKISLSSRHFIPLAVGGGRPTGKSEKVKK